MIDDDDEDNDNDDDESDNDDNDYAHDVVSAKMKDNKLNRVRTTDAFSGELPAYLSLNRLLNGTLSYS